MDRILSQERSVDIALELKRIVECGEYAKFKSLFYTKEDVGKFSRDSLILIADEFKKTPLLKRSEWSVDRSCGLLQATWNKDCFLPALLPNIAFLTKEIKAFDLLYFFDIKLELSELGSLSQTILHFMWQELISFPAITACEYISIFETCVKYATKEDFLLKDSMSKSVTEYMLIDYVVRNKVFALIDDKKAANLFYLILDKEVSEKKEISFKVARDEAPHRTSTSACYDLSSKEIQILNNKLFDIVINSIQSINSAVKAIGGVSIDKADEESKIHWYKQERFPAYTYNLRCLAIILQCVKTHGVKISKIESAIDFIVTLLDNYPRFFAEYGVMILNVDVFSVVDASVMPEVERLDYEMYDKMRPTILLSRAPWPDGIMSRYAGIELRSDIVSACRSAVSLR